LSDNRPHTRLRSSQFVAKKHGENPLGGYRFPPKIIQQGVVGAT
jgi:hypothetical protein